MHWVWPGQALLTGMVLGAGGVALAAYAARRRRQALVAWASNDRAAPARLCPARRVLRQAALAAALGLILVALARPQGAARVSGDGPRGGVLLLVDTSASMRATDAGASRLAAARRWAQDLVGQMPACRIGLATFAGEAQVLCPPTTDHDVVYALLADLPVDMVACEGTRIPAALRLGQAVVRRAGGGVLVLISDGESHADGLEPDPVPADGPPCHLVTVAVGGTVAVPVPDRTPGAVVTDPRTGLPAMTAARPDALRELARAGHGLALAVTPADSTVRRAAEFCAARLDGLSGEPGGRRRPEGFLWALLPALLLLALRFALPETPRVRAAARPPHRGHAWALPALGLALLPSTAGLLADDPPAPPESPKIRRLREDIAVAPGHDHPRLLYNLALALHQAGAVTEARQTYAQALALPGCLAPVRARCLNNLAELAVREARELAPRTPQDARQALARAQSSLAEARRLDPALAAVSANLQDAAELELDLEARRLQAQMGEAREPEAPAPPAPTPASPAQTLASTNADTAAAGAAPGRPGTTPRNAPMPGPGDLERLCQDAGSAPEFLRLLAQHRMAGRKHTCPLPW